jgi:hypothetical protein
MAKSGGIFGCVRTLGFEYHLIAKASAASVVRQTGMAGLLGEGLNYVTCAG